MQLRELHTHTGIETRTRYKSTTKRFNEAVQYKKYGVMKVAWNVKNNHKNMI